MAPPGSGTGSRSREIAEEDGDLFSATVIFASRLAARPKVAKSLSLTPFAGSLPAKASSSRPLPAWTAAKLPSANYELGPACGAAPSGCKA